MASSQLFAIVLENNFPNAFPLPYLRDDEGQQKMYCISPHHGRSFVVGQQDGRYIVSKGNGLSYSTQSFIHTGEFGDDTFGLLLRYDAERDFKLGEQVASLGIKTNHMEYVIQIETALLINNKNIKPILLQYSVECPYRICDAPFMSAEMI